MNAEKPWYLTLFERDWYDLLSVGLMAANWGAAAVDSSSWQKDGLVHGGYLDRSVTPAAAD